MGPGKIADPVRYLAFLILNVAQLGPIIYSDNGSEYSIDEIALDFKYFQPICPLFLENSHNAHVYSTKLLE